MFLVRKPIQKLFRIENNNIAICAINTGQKLDSGIYITTKSSQERNCKIMLFNLSELASL